MEKISLIGPFSPPISGPGVKNNVFLETLKSKGYNVYKINTLKWTTKIVTIIFKIFKSKKIILAVSSNGRYLLLPIMYLFKKLSKNFIYVVVPMGGQLYSELSRMHPFVRFIYKRFLEEADFLFVETKKLRDNLKNKIGIKSTVWLPNFRRNKIINSKSFNKNDNFRFVFLSRVKPSKGIEIALEAIKQINEKNDELYVKFDIYGPISEWYENKFHDLLKNYDFAKYKNCVESEKVSEVIAKYDAFVFPTYWKGEGFPGVLIDALIANIPIIATKWQYNSEIIRDEENGLIVEVKNVKDLHDKMLELITNKELAEKFKRNNKEYVKQFLADNVVDRLLMYLKAKSWFDK